RPDDLARLGSLYEQSGFGARLAGVVGFARARLDGEVVVAEAGADLAGVAAGAVFEGTGWVGGVAVVPGHRRAGLGGALTEAILQFLEGRGVATALLHATALGRPVYERLGFVPEAAYLTLTGPTRPRSPGDPPVRPGRPADLDAVLALDRSATGEDRRRLLTALWPTGGLVAGDRRPLGYHLASPWRPGGAVVAADPRAGLALLEALRATPGDEVAISVPAANTPAVQSLEEAGFAERSRTIRMHRGPRIPWNPTALFGAHNLFWG
ncbi:MAG TPA: GNAT family N-acetyltransferase, partial [Actinomycetota bacterium]|nr:GNAT family N-acetyltransferase [Actinomycetota bacterium]